jgi:type IV pilus assembly protein PilQ
MAFRNILILMFCAFTLASCATSGGKDTDGGASASEADQAFDNDPDFAGQAKATPNTTQDTAAVAQDALQDPGDVEKNLQNQNEPVAPELSLDDSADASATQAPQAQAAPPPPALEEAPAPSESPASPPPVAVEAPSAPSATDVEIKNVRYVAGKNGGTLVIDTSGPATYRTREATDQNQFIVEIANAHLPKRLKRPLITKDFKQSIASIDAYQEPGSTTARFVIQFREPATASIQQNGNALTVAAGGPSGNQQAKASSDDDLSDTSVDVADKSFPNNSQSNSLDDSNMHFYGKPISIEFRDTPVADVISSISELSGANIIVSSEAKGSVTLKLKEVPWDQALMLVMKSRSLGYVRQGNVLRIAPLEGIRAEADAALKVVEAQHAAEPLKVKVIPVSYAKASDLQTQLAGFLSSRGKVQADTRTASVVVTDIAENLERVTNLIKALDAAPLQVLIEGKVVEASEQLSRSFGVNWRVNPPDTAIRGATLSQNLNINPGQLSGNGGLLNFTFGTLELVGDLSASLALYETKDMAKVLSSPRIATMNNEAANINQTTAIPIATVQTTASGNITTYSYQKLQLLLEVIPQITSQADVILQMHVKRELALGVATSGSAPSIDTREATTKVMVHDGQTAVVGGIYQNDASTTDQGVPYIKDVPVIGWLFKNRSVLNKKNELLIFLTPRILNSDQLRSKSEAL